jgi:hypothetical protein
MKIRIAALGIMYGLGAITTWWLQRIDIPAATAQNVAEQRDK